MSASIALSCSIRVAPAMLSRLRRADWLPRLFYVHPAELATPAKSLHSRLTAASAIDRSALFGLGVRGKLANLAAWRTADSFLSPNLDAFHPVVGKMPYVHERQESRTAGDRPDPGAAE
jgi:hypothetical protein